MGGVVRHYKRGQGPPLTNEIHEKMNEKTQGADRAAAAVWRNVTFTGLHFTPDLVLNTGFIISGLIIKNPFQNKGMSQRSRKRLEIISH